MNHSERGTPRVVVSALLACALMGVGHAAPAASGRLAAGELLQVSGHGERRTVTIAPSVLRAVRRYYPGFRVARFADYDPDLVKDLAQRPYRLPAPFACVGDYDRNGLPDVALLLTRERREWCVVVFHQTRHGGFRPHRLGRWSVADLRENNWYTDQGMLYFWIQTAEGREVGVPHASLGIRVGDGGQWNDFFFSFRHGRYHSQFLSANA
jgi:hypothetical protein